MHYIAAVLPPCCFVHRPQPSPAHPALPACAAYRATYPDKEDPLIDLRMQFKCAPVWLWCLLELLGAASSARIRRCRCRLRCRCTSRCRTSCCPVIVPSLSLRQALRMPSMLLQTRTSLPGLPGCNLPLPPPALLPCAGSC